MKGTRNKKGDIFVMEHSQLTSPIKFTPLGKAFARWIEYTEEKTGENKNENNKQHLPTKQHI